MDSEQDQRDSSWFVVEVEPLGVTLQVGKGETLIEAAWRLGYYWPTVCGGRAECRACSVIIEAGVENTLPADSVEQARIDLAPPGRTIEPGDRLACRLTVEGPVRVRKEGVRKTAG
jgi:ferredoxin